MTTTQLAQIIFVYTDGTTQTVTPAQVPTKPTVIPVLNQTLKQVYHGRPVEHNGNRYSSMSLGERATGINRYWIRKFANTESNGWRYV